MAEHQVTDLSYLREVTMGDEDIVIDTVETFLNTMPEVLRKMEASCAENDWQELAELAHQVKPNMSYLGIDRARTLILSIEEQAKKKSISEEFEDQFVEFGEVCQLALDELSGKLEELQATE